MSEESFKRGWIGKFKGAFYGVGLGIWGQSSFYVHIPVAMAVISFAIWFQLPIEQFSILILCIAIVLSAELFNSALESIAKAITSEFDDNIRVALEVASGAVLVTAIGAAAVGAMILYPHFMSLIS